MFTFQKSVDRSTLRQGFQIPVEFHPLLDMTPGGMPNRGEVRAIKVLVDGVEYDAQLKNQPFDQDKYEGHADVVQVRYSENSPLSKKLRETYKATWNYVEYIKNLPENISRKFTIKVPEEQQEFLVLCATELPDVFVAECVTLDMRKQLGVEVCEMSELDFETFEPREDRNASIKEMACLKKVRLLDRSIGDSLKQLYDFRCQMTGEKIGERFDVNVVEAHHIIPFTVSMNNNTSNIIILSPNYHRIIHKAKPEFDREQLAFIYPNGLVDKVMLDKHLLKN